jgi:hypothetical protein
LLAEVGNGDPLAEHLVAAKPKLGIAVGGEAVPQFRQRGDQVVDRNMVRDIDEFLDASFHLTLPGPGALQYMLRESGRNRLFVLIPKEVAFL